MSLQKRLNEIFCEVFDDDNIILVPEMTANDIENWDSLSHVNLIVAIETIIGVIFSQKDLRSFKNVGELLQCISNKL
jgi:acyl carrier protein